MCGAAGRDCYGQVVLLYLLWRAGRTTHRLPRGRCQQRIAIVIWCQPGSAGVIRGSVRLSVSLTKSTALFLLAETACGCFLSLCQLQISRKRGHRHASSAILFKRHPSSHFPRYTLPALLRYWRLLERRLPTSYRPHVHPDDRAFLLSGQSLWMPPSPPCIDCFPLPLPVLDFFFTSTSVLAVTTALLTADSTLPPAAPINRYATHQEAEAQQLELRARKRRLRH
jgi:hypothetical protein